MTGCWPSTPRSRTRSATSTSTCWEIDRFWPEHDLAVELDGRPYHVAANAMERDRIKDAFLLRQGITPLRFTDFRVEHDLPGILRDLRHFLKIA